MPSSFTIHGTDGVINFYVPGHDENVLKLRREFTKTDVFLIPKHINEIILVGKLIGHALGGSATKIRRWFSGVPGLILPSSSLNFLKR
jgi:hypothetical protein